MGLCLLAYVMLGALFAFSRSRSSAQDRRAQQIEGANKMILKVVMLMQQALFLIIQAILLLIALRAGSGAIPDFTTPSFSLV